MIKNKFYQNIKESIKKLISFKSKNSKYRELPKDVDAERHPEEQMYPDILQAENDSNYNSKYHLRQ